MMNINGLPNAKCWRCGVEVDSACSKLCATCHIKEVAKVHEHDTPTTPEVSILGDKYYPPPWRYRRPTSSGRRIMRNEKSLQ